jgi:hypothetical protein
MIPMESTMENRGQQRQKLGKKQEYLDVNKNNRIRFKLMCIFTITLLIVFFLFQFFPQSTINEHSANSNDHHDNDRRRFLVSYKK